MLSIDELGALGDLVGGIAVVAGLMFVGVQLLVANREARLAANRTYSESLTNLAFKISENGEFAALYSKGLHDFDSLEQTDRERFISFVASGLLKTFESQHTYYLAGKLDQSNWDSVDSTLRYLFSMTGINQVWSLRKFLFNASFLEYIEELILTESVNDQPAEVRYESTSHKV